MVGDSIVTTLVQHLYFIIQLLFCMFGY